MTSVGHSACVSQREELHVSDLGDGCLAAVPLLSLCIPLGSPPSVMLCPGIFKGTEYYCFA